MSTFLATSTLGFLLQVDATGIEGFIPSQTEIQGGEDHTTTLQLTDDGVEPDAVAGDAIFTSGVRHFGADEGTLSIHHGEQQWTTQIQIDGESDKPVVRVRLSPDGGATQEQVTAAPQPDAPRDGTPPDAANRRPMPSDPANMPSRLQWLIWAATIFGAGLMAGIAFSGAWTESGGWGGGQRRRNRRRR
jgi:hypothetical protein